jgi:thiamine biosynthesis lipoprotein
MAEAHRDRGRAAPMKTGVRHRRWVATAAATSLAVLLNTQAAQAQLVDAGATEPGAATASAIAPRQKHAFTGQAMGTVVQVTLWTDDAASGQRAADAVFAEFRRLDEMMTTWLPGSEVSQINAAAGKKAVVVSEETFAVIARAVDISRRSRGVFDITVGAFAGLWKFDEDMDGSIPSPAEVKRRVRKVSWRRIVLDEKRRSVNLSRPGMSITLGGIAKGYAVDKGAEVLRRLGHTDFIVQAGGDMYVSGRKGAEPWVVAIRDPRGQRGEMFAIAPVENHSFSTSGDYERGFVKDGVRYHHILDPRTGRPAMGSRSVTILAKDAFTADAWSKVLFILGAKKAMRLVEQLDDFEAVFVDAENQVQVSSGLRERLRILRPPSPGI